MDSLFCNDNSHDVVPEQSQPFVRAKCPLPKMLKEQKGSDGHYHSRITHRAAVKQRQVNEYHALAKQELQKLEKAKEEAGAKSSKVRLLPQHLQRIRS